jgi:hypothetical protein
MGFESDRLDDPRTVVVTPSEPADEHQDVVVLQTHGFVDQGIDVHTEGYGTGQFEGMRRLVVAVEPESGEDESIDLGHSITSCINYKSSSI